MPTSKIIFNNFSPFPSKSLLLQDCGPCPEAEIHVYIHVFAHPMTRVRVHDKVLHQNICLPPIAHEREELPDVHPLTANPVQLPEPKIVLISSEYLVGHMVPGSVKVECHVATLDSVWCTGAVGVFVEHDVRKLDATEPLIAKAVEQIEISETQISSDNFDHECYHIWLKWSALIESATT